MVDGSTDSSILDVVLSYIRYSIRGDVFVKFLAAKGLEKADADNIVKLVILSVAKTYLDFDEQNLARKLVGFSSDGASIMTGRIGGVSAKLKELQPLLQVVHCMAHRLELALKDVFQAKNLSYINELVELVKSLYLFYYNNPLNRKNLEKACDAACVKFYVPSKATGTRWVGNLYHVLEVIVKMYPVLINHFQQVLFNLTFSLYSVYYIILLYEYLNDGMFTLNDICLFILEK